MIINAAGLWQKETSLPTIATFSRSLDNVLGNNGIQLGSITEVLGLSGTGKTQLCSQITRRLGGRSSIVLMNQMSTRIGLSTGAVVGALGDGWAHRCNIRLLLSAPRNVDAERVAALLKSNSSPETVGRFRICQDGIRDIL
ncbi:unnamed protein product [Leptidea sinapis]|uniref:Rad51-like C-terminal domain-containing protein n=1 Tax=Leptidea sinapis TaxID=189913 RepID=A0A5E4QZP3_9NEOP|nr:unnamed protein product [Leptidea sinapis]